MSKRQHEWTYKQPESETEIGPVTESQFVALVKKGIIKGNTLVRSSTRTQNKWIAVKRIPAVAKLIKQPDRRTTTKPTPAKTSQGKATAVPGAPVANPYEAPKIDSEAGISSGLPNAAKNICERFKPLNSTLVTWLLRATMLLMGINGLCLLSFILNGRSNVPSIATAQMVVFVIQLVLFLATAVFFLRWKYQAYSNLQVACAKKLKTSAGWSIAVYFIPLLNLFRPATAMYEIQSRSKANIGVSVIAWWILIILQSILERIAWSAPGSDHKGGQTVSLIAICMTIIAGYLLLKIIRTVTEKQRRYWVSLGGNPN